jgi:hypothetical protein
VSPKAIDGSRFACKHCEKSYSLKRNLTRHHKTCKSKNIGDVTMLKTLEHERDMRLKHEKTIDDMRAGIGVLITKVDMLTSKIQDMKTEVTVQSNNITINNYKTPDISDINVDLPTLMNSKLIESIMGAIYFNPDKPENHCILSQNIKQKRVAVYDNGWKLLTSERELERLIDSVKANCLKNGEGMIEACDQSDITPVQTNKVQSFNGRERDGEACITDDEVLKVFHKHRDMVTATKKVTV